MNFSNYFNYILPPPEGKPVAQWQQPPYLLRNIKSPGRVYAHGRGPLRRARSPEDLAVRECDQAGRK